MTPIRCIASPTAGHTMVEVSVSAAILAVLSFGAVIFLGGTMESMHSTSDTARVQNQGVSGVLSLEQDFSRSDPHHIEIVAESQVHDRIYLQVPIEIGASGPVWGAARFEREDPTGVGGPQRSSEWRIRYRVVGSNLVREIVDANDRPLARSETVVVRDLVPPEHILSQSRLGSLLGRSPVFHVEQIDPGGAPNLYAVWMTTALTSVNAKGLLEVGPTQSCRATLRANRH